MNPVRGAYCRIFQQCFHVALPFLPYRVPDRLATLEETVALLGSKGVKSVLLVTDPSVRKLGITKPLEDAIEQAGIGLAVFDETKANPTTNDVERAYLRYRNSDCTAIIGFGGGSAIDCAKGVGVRVARPGTPLSKLGGILKVWKPLPLLIAIPTTAGTGSETTLASVVVDSETRHKYAINDFPLIPDYAVLDAEVTRTLPPKLTATTGMDALTHAVEAYIGQSTTKETRAYAMEAVKAIFTWLPEAVEQGDNLEARQGMLQAAFDAGNAFTRSYVGYCHAVSHSLSGKYNTPHGLANAILLPKTLEAYGTSIHGKLKKLAIAVDLATPDTPADEAAGRFIKVIKDFNDRFDLGTTFPELREEDIPQLSTYADQEANPLYPVPRLMDRKQLQNLYYDVLPNFREESDAAGSGDEGASMRSKKAAEMAGLQESDIEAIVAEQREFFLSGATLSIDFRMEALLKLRAAIKENEQAIYSALKRDLGKGEEESYMCEVGLTLAEINYMLKHTPSFAQDKTVWTPMAHFLGRSFIMPKPRGVTLVMSPWNYPLMLSLEPVVDAIAAGNTVVVKPSAYSPATSLIVERIIKAAFDPRHVAVVTGGRQENKELLDQKFDHIFFTGSKAVGREVMEKAAAHLTPVTLELGGKSPCIIDRSVNIPLAAKRVVWGKFLNVGQTCVAPDYILVHEQVHDRFIAEVRKQIVAQFGTKPLFNPDYGHIVNQKHFERVRGLMQSGIIVHGGDVDEKERRIEPTVLDGVSWDDPVMQEEIFGPLMPVLTYRTTDEVIEAVNAHPRPLAFYVFSQDRALQKTLLERCHFGGSCINDVVVHLATPHMPFGGNGESGMGCYHGKEGFRTFSHFASVHDKKTWIDMPMRYQPFGPAKDALVRLFVK